MHADQVPNPAIVARLQSARARRAGPPRRAPLGCLAALVLTCGLTACAATQTEDLLEQPGSLPPRAEVAEVPFFPQERYYCGPAALAMVLAWSGLPVTAEDLVSQVYTPGREGTLRSDILGGTRRNGRLAVEVGRLDAMLAELAAGHPVLVFQNLGLDLLPQWHFAVAVGYDLPAGTISLHSGTEAKRRLPLATFERTWRRGDFWALTVLPPDRLPAAAPERDVVEAAAGLERAGRLSEAETAYRTVLGRWPDSHAAFMGLGNTRYAAENASGAEAAYRRAIELRPDAAAAWNNLAYALKAMGRRSEAISAAQQAVALGGSQGARYRESLREIMDGGS